LFLRRQRSFPHSYSGGEPIEGGSCLIDFNSLDGVIRNGRSFQVSMNVDLLRRLDSKSNAIATNLQDRDFDVAVNKELFQLVTVNDEHPDVPLLSVLFSI